MPILACALGAVLTGCAGFESKSLAPAQTASAFETRTLDNPALRRFLQQNFRHEVSPWPPRTWDLSLLTLTAFYYHPDLDVARAQRRVAEAGVLTAGMHPNPSLSFAPQYDADAVGVPPWTLGFSLDIPIETAGKRGHRVQQARYLAAAAQLNIAAIAWQVRSRVRTSLVDLYAARETAALLREQGAVQQDNVRLLEERLAAGFASQPEATLARIALDQTLLALREAQRQGAEARVRLANAIGLPVSGLSGLELSFKALERAPAAGNFSLVRRQALLGRPDILGAIAQYRASEAALRLEVAKQYPDIHLGPGYTWDQGEDKWSLGLSLSLPLFNQNQGPIAEAEARRTEAAARFNALQAGVIGEIDRALAVYHAALRKLETASSLLAAQKTREQAVADMLRAGEEDRLALLGARLERIASALSRLDAQVKVQQSLGLLEDAVQRPLGSSEVFPAMEANPRTVKESGK